MNTLLTSSFDRNRIITLNRGRSNPINQEMVTEIRDLLKNFDEDSTISGVIITGQEGFFSVGLDLLELYDYNEKQVVDFWRNFTEMATDLSSFSKPFVAAISGHSPAGGCVIAMCCDYRVMAKGNYKIGLNEIPVGIVVPDSIFHLYAFWLGSARAYQYLLEGKLMSPEEALTVNLVDRLSDPADLLNDAKNQLVKYNHLDLNTWRTSKKNIRKNLIQNLQIDFVSVFKDALKQWWSPETRAIMNAMVTKLRK